MAEKQYDGEPCVQCGHLADVHHPDCKFGQAGGKRHCWCQGFVPWKASASAAESKAVPES